MAEASAAGRGLATLFRSGTALGMTDGEVIRRAAGARNEDAEALLAAIVERHGAMVLRVCRGVLGDGADADDAFQAVFLVLARRIREAGRLESIGGWLRGVAVRTATRARVGWTAMRRGRRSSRPTRRTSTATARCKRRSAAVARDVDKATASAPQERADSPSSTSPKPDASREPASADVLDASTASRPVSTFC